jgi:hypothetical protein
MTTTTATTQTPTNPGDTLTPEEKSKITRHYLRAKHGTPEEFAAAVWRAQADGFVTAEEAVKAIADYNAEYEAAAATEAQSLIEEFDRQMPPKMKAGLRIMSTGFTGGEPKEEGGLPPTYALACALSKEAGQDRELVEAIADELKRACVETMTGGEETP